MVYKCFVTGQIHVSLGNTDQHSPAANTHLLTRETPFCCLYFKHLICITTGYICSFRNVLNTVFVHFYNEVH